MSVYSQSTNALENNRILLSNITSSGQQHFYFNTQGSLSKRLVTFNGGSLTKRAPTTIYLTLTSCTQPTPPLNYQGEIPSIDLYLSTVNSNPLPGPTNHQNNNTVDDTLPGRISWQTNSGSIPELWIGVAAPTLTPGWTGQWTYELAISTSQWMHPLNLQNDTVALEDTDNSHALLVTKDTTINMTALITQDVPKELKYSYCAAKSYQTVGATTNKTETRRGSGGLRQQMMIGNLTQGQTYQVYMIQQTPATQITGITVPLTIQTLSDPHCRMIYDLDFCSDVAYSVPTDPNQDIWNITRAYDQQAQAVFAPFAAALSQFNCNNTQYSLVRNCDDCYRDYKRWLCSVTIPRCTSPSPWVDTRNVTNSRNPWIDTTYQPGGWTELLPCIDVCYQVVQSCPPFLQFNCPEGDLAAQQYGYWNASVRHPPACNRLGMNESLLVISAGDLMARFSGLLLLICWVSLWIYKIE
ncbi:stretch-activated cation channel Mid1 [Chlamydoabsidia padenii]|nr:stretch-activated cation channel Mid1 [Chlamydoabsidia padenii]